MEIASKLNEARELIKLAVDRQNTAVRKYATDGHNKGLADAIEVETLPRLLECATMLEKAAAAGAKGETFDTLRAYAKARLDAAEMLVDALRSNDAAKLAAAGRLVQEGDRLGQSLFPATAETEDFRRPAVIHLGS
jgi:hypothetical protein